MSESQLIAILDPLVQHKVFTSPEEAARALVGEFILRQIDESRAQIAELEKKYGMSFEHFGAYIKERSNMIVKGQIDADMKPKVAQAIMTEEEDWLDWKIAKETLEDWLGLQAKA